MTAVVKTYHYLDDETVAAQRQRKKNQKDKKRITGS